MTPITGIRVEDGARARRRDRGAASSPARSSSSAPANGRASSAAWPASTCRSSRCSTNTSITEPIEGVTPNLPTLRDPDRLTYYKEEVGGLIMGGYEPNPMPWAEDGIPDGFHLHAARPRLGPFRADHGAGAAARAGAGDTPASSSSSTARRASRRTATSSSARRRRCENVFVGAGFNAFGIASGGGAGMALAEWVAKGEPPYDLWPVDIRRFGRNHARRRLGADAHARGLRASTTRWPGRSRNMSSGRPLRRSPLYDRLKAQGAVFGEKLGWERPNWFADASPARRPRTSTPTAGRTGSTRSAASTRPCASASALFDQTSFAKFLMVGRDAEAALSWICANDVAQAAGLAHLHADAERARRHRVRPDRRAARRGPLLHRHRHRLRHARLRLDRAATSRQGSTRGSIDVTSQNAVLSLMGPRARDVLPGADARRSSRTPASRSARAGTIAVAGAPVLALRITYVGELGWELHVPVEFAATRLRRADGGRAGRTASPMPATARSSRCGWRRAIAPGAPISARTTRR